MNGGGWDKTAVAITRAIVVEEGESGGMRIEWGDGQERSGSKIVCNLCNNRRKRDISMTMLRSRRNIPERFP